MKKIITENMPELHYDIHKLSIKHSTIQPCMILLDPMDYSPPDSMEFPRQEYWSGLPFPPPGLLCLLKLQADSLPLSHLESPKPHVSFKNSRKLQQYSQKWNQDSER